MGTSAGVFGAPLSSVPVPLSVGSVLLQGRRAPPPTPCPGPCPTPLCPWPRIPQLRISPLLQFPEAT